MAQDLDDLTEKLLKDENPTAEAVHTLVHVEKRKQGENSDVDFKTDIPDTMTLNLHTSLQLVGNWMEQTFGEKCVLSDLIHLRERKAISFKRQSRAEIVDVARSPDQNMRIGVEEGMLKRFFTPRPK